MYHSRGFKYVSDILRLIIALLILFSACYPIRSQSVATQSFNPFFTVDDSGKLHGTAGELRTGFSDNCTEGILQWLENDPTGIHLQGFTENFSIFPIPASDILYIENKEGPLQLLIYSIDGELIFTQNLALGLNPIKISALPNNNYVLELRDQNNNFHIQLINKVQ